MAFKLPRGLHNLLALFSFEGLWKYPVSQSVLKPSESEFCVSAVCLAAAGQFVVRLRLSLTGKWLWGKFSVHTCAENLMNAIERQRDGLESQQVIFGFLHASMWCLTRSKPPDQCWERQAATEGEQIKHMFRSGGQMLEVCEEFLFLQSKRFYACSLISCFCLFTCQTEQQVRCYFLDFLQELLPSKLPLNVLTK